MPLNRRACPPDTVGRRGNTLTRHDLGSSFRFDSLWPLGEASVMTSAKRAALGALTLGAVVVARASAQNPPVPPPAQAQQALQQAVQQRPELADAPPSASASKARASRLNRSAPGSLRAAIRPTFSTPILALRRRDKHWRNQGRKSSQRSRPWALEPSSRERNPCRSTPD